MENMFIPSNIINMINEKLQLCFLQGRVLYIIVRVKVRIIKKMCRIIIQGCANYFGISTL